MHNLSLRKTTRITFITWQSTFNTSLRVWPSPPNLYKDLTQNNVPYKHYKTKMDASNLAFSIVIAVLCVSSTVFTQAKIHFPREIASKLTRDPRILSLASTDYGHIVHQTPLEVFEPSSVGDISRLIKFSNSLPTPFTIAPRGQAHSTLGQALARNGVVLNMTNLKGSQILVSNCGGKKKPLKSCYADVGGEVLWIDVLHATLERGLTPLSWTDYLYLSVGGTLSNAGISGQAFRFGPQISNVLELDVVTGMTFSNLTLSSSSMHY